MRAPIAAGQAWIQRDSHDLGPHASTDSRRCVAADDAGNVLGQVFGVTGNHWDSVGSTLGEPLKGS